MADRALPVGVKLKLSAWRLRHGLHRLVEVRHDDVVGTAAGSSHIHLPRIFQQHKLARSGDDKPLVRHHISCECQLAKWSDFPITALGATAWLTRLWQDWRADDASSLASCITGVGTVLCRLSIGLGPFVVGPANVPVTPWTKGIPCESSPAPLAPIRDALGANKRVSHLPVCVARRSQRPLRRNKWMEQVLAVTGKVVGHLGGRLGHNCGHGRLGVAQKDNGQAMLAGIRAARLGRMVQACVEAVVGKCPQTRLDAATGTLGARRAQECQNTLFIFLVDNVQEAALKAREMDTHPRSPGCTGFQHFQIPGEFNLRITQLLNEPESGIHERMPLPPCEHWRKPNQASAVPGSMSPRRSEAEK
eukprot:CAMPEP_0181414602 /NCGR_PEP_ID=MMETSP1110-20121109/9590_1 /TAXON_ID=174948 /ORGANISM="Symbiodinium sp., Strain CCMP421" /LENGTH=361 /DNA_ID=CAMNT_0023537487 /DNA_START=111 /DNA_END=1196 /DNA_ORIENTATION=+